VLVCVAGGVGSDLVGLVGVGSPSLSRVGLVVVSRVMVSCTGSGLILGQGETDGKAFEDLAGAEARGGVKCAAW
jgi:hypothetical protein